MFFFFELMDGAVYLYAAFKICNSANLSLRLPILQEGLSIIFMKHKLQFFINCFFMTAYDKSLISMSVLLTKFVKWVPLLKMRHMYMQVVLYAQ